MGKKNKSKAGYDDYWDEEFEADQESAENENEPQTGGAAAAESTPAAAAAADNDNGNDNAPDASAGAAESNLGPDGKPLSKAQLKRRAKKARLAAAKAAGGGGGGDDAAVAAVAAKLDDASVGGGDADDDDGDGDGDGDGGDDEDVNDGKPMTAAQKKRARKKAAAAKKKAGVGAKKKGGLAAGARAALLKAREEAAAAAKAAEEAARLAEEEAERKHQEELKRQQELQEKRAAAREKKRAKLRNKAKNKESAAVAARRAALQEQYGAPAAVADGGDGDGADDDGKKVVYESKKAESAIAKKKREEAEAAAAFEAKAKAMREAKAAKAKADEDRRRRAREEAERLVREEEAKEDEAVDDWETALEEGGGDNWEDAFEDESTREERIEKKIEEIEARLLAEEEERERVEAEAALAAKEAAARAERDAANRALEAAAAKRLAALDEDAGESSMGDEQFRSPICCILGHVDTGKTKILDKIRHTNVQDGEAGGITQQIGATFFPLQAIKTQTKGLVDKLKLDYKIPGLLIIDTPGHESFTNLRSRGSGLCDIAILVVDIMHGIEPQTLESINLLKMRKTPFIVALNKVDRLFGWRSTPSSPIRESLKRQPDNVKSEFDERVQQAVVQFAEKEMNACLYWKNKDYRKYVSFVPTSAHTGEGIPDLLMVLVMLTQRFMSKNLLYLASMQCTVLEVKVIEGLGTTIDVVLVNGVLNEGDTVVLCGLDGAIVTQVRSLLTPEPLQELRVKTPYIHHKRVRAAQGIKISAPGLEHAIAGSQLLVQTEDDDIEDLKEEVMSDMKQLMNRVSNSGRGVCVQASTLGSLEALLQFLETSKIPVSGVNIGPVYKKDVTRASIMLEHKKEYAVLLAFDVKVEKDAQALADEVGVRIFTAEIIYHLFDQFTKYVRDVKRVQQEQAAEQAVWPCVVQFEPNCAFNKKEPIVIGVTVVEGALKMYTPLVVPTRDMVSLGRVMSIESNHKPVQILRKGERAAIKIQSKASETGKMVGRHVFEGDLLYSKVTRDSINILKDLFREELKNDKEAVALLKKLKKMFDIM